MKAEAAADGFFHIGRDVGAYTHRPRYLADADRFARGPHALLGALELGEPARNLEAQRRGLGVHPV